MAVPKGFVKLDATAPPMTRLIVSVAGREKHGKSHFSLTAPGPIGYLDCDVGTEGVVEKFARNGKVIYHKEYDTHIVKGVRKAGPIDLEPYQLMWEAMKNDLIALLDTPEIKTVIVDTATEMWELLRMARFGKLTQVMPHQYGPVNAEYRALLRTAYLSTKNLILLHRVKAEYLNDKKTGQYERSGFSDTGFLVQVNVRCFRRLNDDQKLEFGVLVEDCRQNADVAGMELIEPLCTFPTLASLVTGTEEKDWE